MNFNRRTALGLVATVAASMGIVRVRAATRTVNGVPYPDSVADEKTFWQWINTIERPSSIDSGRVPTLKPHVELFTWARYFEGDPASHRVAVANVTQSAAQQLFSHLVDVPNGHLVWRIAPEFATYTNVRVPRELGPAGVLSRAQAERRAFGSDIPTKLVPLKELVRYDDEVVDFVTDSIFRAAPERLSAFKAYSRYWVMLDGKAVVLGSLGR